MVKSGALTLTALWLGLVLDLQLEAFESEREKVVLRNLHGS